MKKRKLKNKVVVHLILLNMLLFVFLLGLVYKNRMIEIAERYIIGESLYIVFNDKVSCYLDDEWTDTNEDNALIINLSDATDKLKVKSSSGVVYTLNNDLSFADGIKFDSFDIYLAKGDAESISCYAPDNTMITYESDNDSIASVDENGIIYGNNNGKTAIRIKVNDLIYMIDVTVTDLIVPVSSEFDYNKPFITPDLYTEEENDLIDEILAFRIEKVGYKTRAAAVEAARFLALEFPYRIHYFTENGRIDSYIGI
ncbi:MAG: hypothetical protein IKF80_12025, partial [Erysipelotrichaceae bacterium]|nr:hypothetical protein [Erysipelotrichaceae bacterium]